MIKEAILSTMWMGYGDDGILRLRIIEGAHIDLAMTKLQYLTMDRLIENAKPLVLVDARANFTIDKESYEYAAGQSDKRIATAVLTENSLTKAMTNTYLRLFKPVTPYKMFTDEAAAIEWLKEMKGKNFKM